MDRFDQFLQVLGPILNGGNATRTTLSTEHYAAVDAPSTPGTVQSPLPLTVAAGGPRGLRLAAAYGQQWVTIGPTGRGPRTPEMILESVRTQCDQLREACRDVGRDPGTLGKVVLWTPAETHIDSIDQFDELVAPFEELGFDEFVLHHPDQTGPYGGTPEVFEQIAARGD
jgi:alkanesulfonate monooxygenase SsuD/methylene tetrahydromethanopterin reductase-like flavin-dependent oxidoreductase (luciferase family)